MCFVFLAVKQERPPHLKAEVVHPAFRERGRAIPNIQGSSSAKSAPTARIVEGRVSFGYSPFYWNTK